MNILLVNPRPVFRGTIGFVAACGFILGAASAHAAGSTIAFTSPAGGEVFLPNKSYTIRLATKGTFQSIKIELSRDGGQTFSDIGTIDNSSKDKTKHNTLAFTPAAPPSADCLLRATGAGKTAVTATSMPFTIGSPAATGTSGSITGDMLAANTVTSANMANGSILTAGLADGSVTTPKLADSAVTNPKIANLAVSNTKISSAAVSADFVLAADGLGGAVWTDPTTLGAVPAGAAGGDLTGTYPNPSVAATAGNSLVAAINNAATTSKIAPSVLPIVGAPYVLKTGDTMTGLLDVVGGSIRTDSQFISTIATGTAPLSVTSSTQVNNLNAEFLQGNHASAFALANGPLTNTPIVVPGTAAPSLSAAGQGKLYFDSTSNRLKLSENTAAYNNFVVGTHAPPTTPDASADVMIASSDVNHSPLVLQTVAGQQNPAFKVENSAKIVTFVVESSTTTGNFNTFAGSFAGQFDTTGDFNSFFGAAAGAGNGTGVANCFFGAETGKANGSGNANSFFGEASGFTNSGSSNSFFGQNSGKNNTFGGGNTFIGQGAGTSNTTENNNTFVGVLANGAVGITNATAIGANASVTQSNSLVLGNGSSVGIGTSAPGATFDVKGANPQTTPILQVEDANGNVTFAVEARNTITTGLNNTFAGVSAGIANTAGGNNTFFGVSAGLRNTTGANNTFSGFTAGALNTTGGDNSFYGAGAGQLNTTGDFNTFTGYFAGSKTTTASNNTFTGALAGFTNSTGNYNTFTGDDAGESNTTGSNNTFDGQCAGVNSTTGDYNSFFGQNAGQLNASGSNNTFLGAGAGAANTTATNNTYTGNNAGSAGLPGTASNNTFNGHVAGQFNTGNKNTFVGEGTGKVNAADNNTFVGQAAGQVNTSGTGNAFFGQNAGLSNTTESNNTFIGQNSNGAAGITNATAIGANASVTQSNSLVLGNGCSVGIGTSAPGATLDVAGGSIRTDTQFISTLATGTAPLSVASQTLVNNLNAQFLQGKTPADFAAASGSASYIQNQSAANQAASFQISGTMTGTATAGNVGLTVNGASGKNIADFTINGGGTISIDKNGNFTGNAATAGNVTGTVLIGNGGTGQTTASAAFNALAPTTAKGDIIVSTGTSNTRLPAGADGTVLMADSTAGSGVKWAAAGGTGTVTGVTASVPLTSSGGAAPNIALGTVAPPTKPAPLADAVIGTSAVTQTGLVIQGLPSQSAHLQQWQDSTGAVLSAIDNAGAFTGNAANVTGTVLVANGGTGASSSTAGFNALSPLNAKGDLLAHDGTNNVRLATGTDGQVLTADSASASGVKWAAAAGGGGSSALAVATTTGTTTVNVSGVSVLVLKSGAANDFALTLNGITPGQIIVIENSSNHSVLSVNGDINGVPANGEAQLVYVNDAGAVHTIGITNAHF